MITVLGSINMDLVVLTERAPRPGETVMGREFRTIPGGKGANQAVAAARAGAPVAMIGAVGTDGFGQELRVNLDRDGIDTRLVRTTTGASGTAHIVVDGSGQNAIAVVPGANGSMTSLTADDRAMIRRSTHLLMQLELPLPVVLEGARVARAAGVCVILTPAPAQPLPAELLVLVDWLVPNEHEAETLTGHSDPLAASRQLLDQVGNVVVTLGAAGSLCIARGEKPLRAPAPRVTPVDTTAAGDTFTGAFAVALTEGRPVPEALAFASRAAAISVTRVGAAPSMPSRFEIDTFAG